MSTVKVQGYVIGNEEEHFAGEMEFELPDNWWTMPEYAQALWLNERKREVRKYLFKTEVVFPDAD